VQIYYRLLTLTSPKDRVVQAASDQEDCSKLSSFLFLAEASDRFLARVQLRPRSTVRSVKNWHRGVLRAER